MNKWEREVFLPKLKRKMSDKEFDKVARKYDRNTHNVTRVAFNDIHNTVDNIVQINKLANKNMLKVKIEKPPVHKLSKKWTKKGYLQELQAGPMSEERFEYIMKSIASENTRKFRKELDVQRSIANDIWKLADLA